MNDSKWMNYIIKILIMTLHRDKKELKIYLNVKNKNITKLLLYLYTYIYTTTQIFVNTNKTLWYLS